MSVTRYTYSSIVYASTPIDPHKQVKTACHYGHYGYNICQYIFGGLVTVEMIYFSSYMSL